LAARKIGPQLCRKTGKNATTILTFSIVTAYAIGVPRQPRIQFPGAVYHLVNRGDRSETIFRTDEDRARFVATLGETCAKTGWRVLAYCLMPDHFHLVVETPQPNLVVGMKWFLGTFTIQFNRRHDLTGHLFSGRYKSLVVQREAGDYLLKVCEYVLSNPARAGLVGPPQALREYPWSSLPGSLDPATRPEWLRPEALFAQAGLEDTEAGRTQFERRLEERRTAASDADWKDIRRGWCLGNAEFRRDLVVRAEKPGAGYTVPRKEAAADKAERILAQEMSALGWSDKDLAGRRKADLEKLRLAQLLRSETTVSLKWVAQRLKMGSWTYLANCLYALERRQQQPVRRATPTVEPVAESAPAPIAEDLPPTPGAPPKETPAEPTSDNVEELPVYCL
jgi:putative transposase